MKKAALIALIPAEVILLFLLNYFISNVVDKKIVQPFIIPNLRGISPNITSLIFSGLISAFIAFIIVTLLGVVIKRPIKDLGYNAKNFKFSIKADLMFLTVFMVLYVFVGTLAEIYNVYHYTFPFSISTPNFITFLLFELLISGFEEIYFRCFVITFLLIVWRPIFKSQKTLEIAAVMASAFIFVLGHIGMTFAPFTITYLVPLQLLVVAVMGLYFGYIFIKTGSLLGSYLAHGISNFLIMIFFFVLNIVL